MLTSPSPTLFPFQKRESLGLIARECGFGGHSEGRDRSTWHGIASNCRNLVSNPRIFQSVPALMAVSVANKELGLQLGISVFFGPPHR